ncbi:MAG: alpha-L-arabinofuranosidase [Chloroflexales bacterium]
MVAPPSPADGRPVITVSAAAAAAPLDARLFGTNLPAWVGPNSLGSDKIRALTTALGTSVVRIPGGSWSSSYSWLACETGDGDGCYWTWAAKPTDFLNFVRATGLQAMWTVSINGTAKEAAALVAFFNGSVDDTTLIGVDVRGRDWKTVGDWAKLRAKNGNPKPLPITLWEVGNEVYGAKPASGGDQCASWGWEDVWTCDGTEYMLGKGSGADRHEGYLEFRAAMRAVDPTIMVGAVGVPHPGDWSGWGNKVIEKGGADLDFYSIHYYPYDKQPKSAEAILSSAQNVWKDAMDSTNAAFDTLANGRRAPVAVTEYNLAAFQDLDNGQLMTRAANALFIADMIGQMAVNGVTMANQWNLANGKANNGTDYGVIDVDSGKRAPQYYAMRLWSQFGNALLPVESPLPAETTLSVYAGRSADGSISVLAINKTDKPLDARVLIAGAAGARHATANVVAAKNLEATEITFNGVSDPATDFSDAPAKDLGTIDGFLDYTFAPYAITLIRLAPSR